MKTILYLILGAMMLSCQNAVIQEETISPVTGEILFVRYKVVKIISGRPEQTPYRMYMHKTNMCVFRLDTGREFAGVYDEIDYYADCNEFEIGDEVYLKAFVTTKQ